MDSSLFLIDGAAEGRKYCYESFLNSVCDFGENFSSEEKYAELFDFLVAITGCLVQGRSFEIRGDCVIIASVSSPSGSAVETPRWQEWAVDRRLQWVLDQIRRSSSKLTLHSSGTSGSAKRITHRISTLLASVQVADKHGDDVWAFSYQPGRIAALHVFFQQLFNGNPAVNLYGVDIETAAKCMNSYGVSHISATPTYLKLLTAGNPVFPHVRAVTVGGEVWGASSGDRLQQSFPNARFRNIYAASEFGSLLHSDGDVFRVPEGLRERVQIHCGRLWLDKTLVADSLASRVDERFYDTGDRVELVSAEPLAFRVLGRETDWINVGGVKVDPYVVETALLQISGVGDVRVYGQANSVCGQLVAAEVMATSAGAVDVATIRASLRGQLSPQEFPRIIRLVDQLTVTSSGKKRRAK